MAAFLSTCSALDSVGVLCSTCSQKTDNVRHQVFVWSVGRGYRGINMYEIRDSLQKTPLRQLNARWENLDVPMPKDCQLV